MKLNNRRFFLKVFIAGIVSFFIFIWNKLTLSHLNNNKRLNNQLPFNKNKTVSFEGDFIVVNRKDKTTVFSSHCSHLGCKIDKLENDKLVCPCHGSEYDMEGKVLKGPAYKNLESLPFSVSEDGKNIKIEN